VSNIRRTKIVATLGPASESPEVVDQLVQAGVNIVRLNFSHGTADDHVHRAEAVREAAARHGVIVGVLADMQGPKIRIGKFKTGKTWLKPGQSFILDAALPLEDGDDGRVGIAYKKLVDDVEPGARLLLNDGLIVMDVEKVEGAEIHCSVVNGGELSNNKGINRAGGGLSAKALTDKDKEDIKTAVRLGADYIAISFPRSAEDIHEARDLIHKAGGQAGIVAKIERAEAVKNLEEILHASDAVMVARGDLGVEIGDAAVPPVQKRILRLAPKHLCPVIVATQMMESMITNPVPTRAEVSDVANAVLDGTDAVMLSGETASGNYPVETVRFMHQTCLETEKQNVMPSMTTRSPREPQSVDECIARMAMDTAKIMPIKAIAAYTHSGNTTLYMSRHLGEVPIYALTPFPATSGRVSLYRNVTPRVHDNSYTAEASEAAIRDAEKHLVDAGLADPGDLIVITLGTSMGRSGATNSMQIVRVGETD